MDQATLVSPDLDAGREALGALEASGIKPIVAAFVFLPEHEDWRLVLSSPALDQSHQLKAYQRVTTALAGRFVYSLPLMLILRAKDPLIRELRRLFSTRIKVGPQTVVHLGGQTIGNRFIPDAYILSAPSLAR